VNKTKRIKRSHIRNKGQAVTAYDNQAPSSNKTALKQLGYQKEMRALPSALRVPHKVRPAASPSTSRHHAGLAETVRKLLVLYRGTPSSVPL
jgi:hypothetical protein